jgi:hypothetical protein
VVTLHNGLVLPIDVKYGESGMKFEKGLMKYCVPKAAIEGFEFKNDEVKALLDEQFFNALESPESGLKWKDEETVPAVPTPESASQS